MEMVYITQHLNERVLSNNVKHPSAEGCFTIALSGKVLKSLPTYYTSRAMVDVITMC